jgi:hypothetical protein
MVSGADALANASIGETGIGVGEAQANAGFEVSGVALDGGFLPFEFLTIWNLLTNESFAQMSVSFYFNDVQIGGFTHRMTGAGETFPQETISSFLEPVFAGEAYTYGALAMVQAGPQVYVAFATAEVQSLVPEPGTIFLAGFGCIGLWILRRAHGGIQVK